LIDGFKQTWSKKQYIINIGYLWDNLDSRFVNSKGIFDYKFFETKGLKLNFLKDTRVGQDEYFLKNFLGNYDSIISEKKIGTEINFDNIKVSKTTLLLNKELDNIKGFTEKGEIIREINTILKD